MAIIVITIIGNQVKKKKKFFFFYCNQVTDRDRVSWPLVFHHLDLAQFCASHTDISRQFFDLRCVKQQKYGHYSLMFHSKLLFFLHTVPERKW